MKTLGIVAEYNPFHNGHLYQIRQLKSRTGADFVIAVMSGDFVQRGEPAIYDKYTRTRMALSAGVDLVLEIPVCFATGSAEDFAGCGVALLDGLGVVDMLGFGSEAGDCRLLSQAAAVLAEEPEEFVQRLQALLKQGFSFPAARASALEGYFASSRSFAGAEDSPHIPWSSLLLSPNNILAVEYLKALIRRRSPLEPITLRRVGQGYHEETCAADPDIFASASALRRAIREGNFAMIRSQIPREALSCWEACSFSPSSGLAKKDGSLPPVPVFSDDLSTLLNFRLLALAQADPDHPFDSYADMGPELACRLKKNLLNFDSFSGRVRQLKTRSYTYTRISRALLHLLLGITAEDTAHYRQQGYVKYARILGFRPEAGPLLSRIRKNGSLPLIAKTADAPKKLEADSLSLLRMDFYASHIYQSLVFSKTGGKRKNEYTQSPIRP